MTHATKPLNLGTWVPHSKGYQAAKNGREISILASVRVSVVKWSSFGLSDCHILISHMELCAFWVHTGMKSDSGDEDYIAPSYVSRAVRMLSSPHTENTGGFLVIVFYW